MRRGIGHTAHRSEGTPGKPPADDCSKEDHSRNAEQDPPRLGNNKARPLARFFSEALPVANLAAVHFRLFGLSADGKEFLLYQTEAKEISVCSNGPEQATKFKARLLSTTGAFIGNGAGSFYESGQFGSINADGLAERRWLETLELHARQTMRHTRALLTEFDPRLLVDYISTPDDMLHSWWGLATEAQKSNEPQRRWGYQIVDWRIEQLRLLLRDDDHFVIVSDHGMTAVSHEVRVNTLIKDFGFEGRIIASSAFLRLKDRSETALLEEVRKKLSDVQFEGKPVFSSWYLPSEFASKFGIGGEFGGDLYFDLAPGFTMTHLLKQPAIIALPRRIGVHGPLPTRSDLLALFVASGPEIQSRSASMKSVDVAPFVLRLLGL